NILRKATEPVAGAVQPALLQEPAEQALHAALAATLPGVATLFDHGDYAGALQTLAALRGPVDAFFDDVMVNAEDAALRNNRLALLASLHAAMNRIADLGRLAA
ncbi:MAG: glycine--tRNA ligase subunit beta, partial [Rhodocyclaceae bacterium]|nr:glycine--tRNA ligase subunit beta [Rhodocyclaceae bacterium]